MDNVHKATLISLAGALVGASSVTANSAGQPTRNFKKDVIRVGEYYKGASGKPIKFTKQDLINYADTHSKLRANGVEIPMPNGHDVSDATKNMGFVRDLFVEDETLWMNCEAIGQDAIDAASRNFVSLCSEENFVDGTGAVHAKAITHVAMTPIPVVPGQGGFIPIKLSRGETIKALALSPASPGASNMVQQIAMAMGIDASGKDDATLTQMIIAKCKGGMGGDPNAPTQAQFSQAQTELAAAKSELETLKLSRSKGETNPTIISLASENRTAKLDRLVDNLNIMPVTRDELHAAWVGKDNGELKLSLDADGNARFDAMVAALSKNDPKLIGSKFNENTLALSRTSPGLGRPDDKEMDAIIKRNADEINAAKNRK